MIVLLSPHGDKLRALLKNKKLPEDDRNRILEAKKHYEIWLEKLRLVHGDYNEIVTEMVSILNEYKQFIELNVIYDSNHNFLYRQKGQLKLDNTVIEEFLPILLTTVLSELLQNCDLSIGPVSCYSGLSFESNVIGGQDGGGMHVRTKDHDFTVSRSLFIRSSHKKDFRDSKTIETNIAYIAAECKTNLDKTMFQEATATALDVKLAVPGAKYFLLCEWLDMTPISTNITAIDEILILRRAKRLSSNIRQEFSSQEGRKNNRGKYIEYLNDNPFSPEVFMRFLGHVRSVFDENPENEVLKRGYF